MELTIIGKNKTMIVSSILQRQLSIKNNGSFQELKKELNQYERKGFQVIELYKKHFNWVDRFNRLWYSLDDKHGIDNWKTKLLFSIFRIAIINSWVLYNQYDTIDLFEWRKILSQEIFHF